MNRVLLQAIFLLLALGSLRAQAPLSLSDAIQLALRNNYQIQIAERDIEVADNNNSWVAAGRYPAINLSATANNTFVNSQDPAGFLIERSILSNAVTPSVSATVILFDGYRIKLTKQQLEKESVLSRDNAQVTIENAIRSVMLAYYNAQLQKERLAVLDEVLKLSRDRVAYQKIRQEFGQAGTFDFLQSQDAYLNDSTNYLVQLTTYDNALRSLLLTMGMDDMSLRYELTDQLAFSTERYDIETLRAKMLSANKNLQSLFTSRELAQIGTQIAETRMRPTVTMQPFLSYGINLQNGSQTFLGRDPVDVRAAARTLNGAINFTATYTLYDWGARRIVIDNAKVNELRVQLNIEDLKRNLSNQLENTLATYNNQQSLVGVTGQNVENARRNLEIAEERFKGGLINSFDYRTIQLNYINATQGRLNAIFNLKNTETELIRLIGGLVR